MFYFYLAGNPRPILQLVECANLPQVCTQLQTEHGNDLCVFACNWCGKIIADSEGYQNRDELFPIDMFDLMCERRYDARQGKQDQPKIFKRHPNE